MLFVLNSKVYYTYIPIPPKKGMGSKPLDEPF